MKKRRVVLVFSMCLPASLAQADVALTSIAWEFYQGGYVQGDSLNFLEVQDHFRDSPDINTVNSMVGGALFESVATMEFSISHSADLFGVQAVNTLSAFASVASDSPDGLAHAFAGLSMFTAEFELTDDSYVYMGSDPLEGADGVVQSGDVLAPGMYGFYLIDPFPSLTQTALFVQPGAEELVTSSRTFQFTFQQIPHPAGLSCFIAMSLIASRRRRY